MLRSFWLPLLSSLLFELVELGLKHQLPYFFECWWDRVSLFSEYLIQFSWSKEFESKGETDGDFPVF